MTRCSRVFSRCLNNADRAVRLAGVSKPVALCTNCVESARSMGMDPQPVPEWIARGVMQEAKGADLTGWVMGRVVA